MKNKFYITIGLPASNKTRYYDDLKRQFNNDLILLDSDEIRKELFGYESQEDNNLVFKIMKERTIKELKNGNSVYYCATNISRKYRKDILNIVSSLNIEAIALLFYVPFKDILNRNAMRIERNIPLDKIKTMLCCFDIPLRSEGFSTIYVIKDDNSENKVACDVLKSEEFCLDNYNQNNKYHNKTLGGHIRDVISYIEKQKYNCKIERGINEELTLLDSLVLMKVAYLHDLGKLYTRQYKEDGTCCYYGHEKVSSYMALEYFEDVGEMNNVEIDILEIIYYHMIWYQIDDEEKIKEKINNDYVFRMLKIFHQADKYRED